jgi:hypothetical protein
MNKPETQSGGSLQPVGWELAEGLRDEARINAMCGSEEWSKMLEACADRMQCMENTLREIKRTALESTDGPRALAHIVRLCIDAGITPNDAHHWRRGKGAWHWAGAESRRPVHVLG